MIDARDVSKIGTKAFLVGIDYPHNGLGEANALLDELKELVSNLGWETAESLLVRLREPQPRFLIGGGKAEEIAKRAEELGCSVIVFDEDLSPGQQRNWEEMTKMRVMDRQEVILDIFARRAHTKEAVLQVELARMEYALPRLKNAWTHLSRQRGGGVAQRGEGETQLELDQRMAKERISKLRRELEDVVRQRATQRKLRQRVPLPTAAIVGYTNAGKSTLLRRLTGSDVLVADQLFATLDPATRQLALPSGRKLLVTDTVGFVRRLPHRLVEAFKATLEEAVQSDFLIHVVDASSPDLQEHEQTTLGVLKELGADDKPILTVYNKIDRLTPEARMERFAPRRHDELTMEVSAQSGLGMDALLAKMDELALQGESPSRLLIPHSRYDIIHRLHASGCVREEKPEDDGVVIIGHIPPRMKALVEPFMAGHV